jgi:TonB-linked SusC/RagA family outer membrane protein
MKKKRLAACVQAVWKVTVISALSVFLAQPLFAIPFLQELTDKHVSLSVDQEEIRKVLGLIQEQTGIKFVYSSTAVPVDQKVSVHVTDKAVADVLREMLGTQQIQYKIMDDRILLFKGLEPAVVQNVKPNAERWLVQTVTGRVADSDNMALPGVSIMVKGSTKGTTTDNNGVYALAVGDDDILVFSFIGFKTQEQPVRGRTQVDIVLESDASELDEVVIQDGYGERRKESFTGGPITVSGEELRRVNPMNLLQSIQSFDPSFRVQQDNSFGSDPNRLPDIQVRGATGLPSNAAADPTNGLVNRAQMNNPNLPTFILNGFQVSIQTIYDLDMNRIESITLLKDAAAAAIYGSRAANGVVVITLKKPEEGALQVTFNYDMQVTGPDLSVYDVLNAKDKLEYERLAGVYTANYDRSDWGQVDLDRLYYHRLQGVEQGNDSYWLSEPLQTEIGHKASLAVEGGSNALTYRITGRYQTLAGVMKGSKRDRSGLEAFLQYNKEKFNVSNSIQISQVSAHESPYGSFEQYVKMNPYYRKTDENGNVLQVLDYLKKLEAEGFARVLNPVYDAGLHSFDKNVYTQIINQTGFYWRMTPRFELRGQLNLDKKITQEDLFKSPLRNEYIDMTGEDLKKRGEYQYKTNDEITYDGNVVLNYNKAIDRHMIVASLGGNVRSYTSDFKAFRTIGFVNDRFDHVGFATRYKDEDMPGGWYSQERLLGFFANGNYSYKDRYLADLSVRMDGSSKFGSDNKFAPFWAAGVGWNLHKEDFLQGNPNINQLKLRATTGVTGEVSFESYLAETTYRYFNDWYSSGVGASFMGYGNSDLRWQRTRQYDLGIESIFFKNRLSVTLRGYYKLTDDLVADIVTPPSLGFSSYKSNLGKMENKGLELYMRGTVYRDNHWNISLWANASRNVNTIKAISEGLKKYNEQQDEAQDEEDNQTTPLLRYNEGQSLNTIYAIRSLGIDPENGKEIFVRKNGTRTYEYSVKDFVPVGNMAPKVDGSFGADIMYRNVTLSLNFYGRFGGDMYNQTLIDRVENAWPYDNVDARVFEGRWKKPGDHAAYKDIADWTVTRASSRFVQRENTIELRSANIFYEVPSVLARRWKMRTMRLGVTANDIARWSTIKMERGIDYPFARSVTFSLFSTF